MTEGGVLPVTAPEELTGFTLTDPMGADLEEGDFESLPPSRENDSLFTSRAWSSG